MRKSIFALSALFLVPTSALAAVSDASGGHGAAAETFLWIAVILLAAKLASSMVERLGQSAVLGELLIGVLLGNLGLIGIHVFSGIAENEIIMFLAELGVAVLLFQIGLESNLQKMREVGVRSLSVAIIGVVLPFVLGTYVVGPWLLPGLPFTAYLFLGAAMTATSVSIPARMFKDLGRLQTSEAQIILGAAVIDDVLGLIILAVAVAIASAGSVTLGAVAWIALKAFLFLAGAVILGQLLAPWIGKVFSRIHTGHGMKFTLAFSFALIFGYLASDLGLAIIVGAFAAGLVLDPVHFRSFSDPHIAHDLKEAIREESESVRERVGGVIRKHSDRHVEELIEPVAFFLVPIFFVMTGMAVNLQTLSDPSVVIVALGITVAAFIGKIAAGSAAGNVNRWIVGWGMVPRGEVGLIFATIGRSLGVVPESLFSVIVIVVILTTLGTPPVLAYLLRKS